MAIANLAVYRNKMRSSVYLLNFIFSLQLATTSYYAANYLMKYGISKEYLSFIFTLASILAIFAFYLSSFVLNFLGARKTVLFSAISYALAMLLQAELKDIGLISLVFILSAVPNALIVASLDTLMERFTESDSKTGTQRGLFITMASAAFVLGPFLGGLLVKGGDFEALWLAAFGFMIPFLVISFWSLRKVNRIAYNKFNIKKTFEKVINNKDILYIFLSQFVLYFFYAIMVIYTSVFLRDVFNISYKEIGIIFAIMLTPFVFLTVPLGKIADKYLGEKEILITGFVIMSIATFIFAINNNPSIYALAAILFLTRIGAAATQAMTESYFFKKIDGKDVDILSAFRAMYPLANIIGPIAVSPILFFASFRWVYIFLAVFTLLGVYFAYKIHDTK